MTQMKPSVVLPVTPMSANSSSEKFWPTFLLALFLGIFGAHRFYLKSPKRILMFLTLGGLGMWAMIDVLKILLGKFEDTQGQLITNPKPALSWGLVIVVFVVGSAGDGKSGVSGVKLEGKKLTAEYHLGSGDYALEVSMKMTEFIHKLAKNYPDAESLSVTLMFNKSGLTDSYGNRVSGIQELSSSVDVEDLGEVRKYADWKAYYNHGGIGHWLPIQLRASAAGKFLK
jgi:hypothetical protein